MKKQNLILWGLTLATVIALAACTAQPVAQPTEQPVAQATSTAAIVATTAPTATVAPTATAEPTATLEPTATIAMEPTASNENVPTPTANVAFVGGKVVISLSQNTICRTGPATNYPSVASIPAGQQLNAVGKLENNTSYTYIENPTTPGTYCWVFSEGATIQGSRTDLKIVKPLPTPTSETGMNFSLSYGGIQQCPGDDYSFNIIVTNTDKLVWQSIKIFIVDANTKTTANYSSGHFEGWTDCHVDFYQDDLTEGEHAFISPYDPGHFDYNPKGGTFFVRVQLCSNEDLTGTCMTKELKVKP